MIPGRVNTPKYEDGKFRGMVGRGECVNKPKYKGGMFCGMAMVGGRVNIPPPDRRPPTLSRFREG